MQRVVMVIKFENSQRIFHQFKYFFLKGYGKAAATSWYNEVKYWSFKTSQPYSGKTTGHFTQNVWCYTKTIGVGASTFVGGGWNNLMIVANFQPGGNYNKLYSTNVKANSTACKF